MENKEASFSAYNYGCELRDTTLFLKDLLVYLKLDAREVFDDYGNLLGYEFFPINIYEGNETDGKR